MSALRLTERLRHALREQPVGALCVAFSGGPDSTALLHALAAMPEARVRGLRALHVDHGLQADSARWARHCTELCDGLGIACAVVRVDVVRHGEGLEAAARRARYAAFAATLRAGERLVLAHHRDDQAETVLLKLLRGAGPEGLGGMRETRPLGHGVLWRPLLALPRAALREYLDAHDLVAIDDPANADTTLARNHLRHVILPRLAVHWPHAAEAIAHSAALCRAATDALRREWLAAFARLHDARTNSLEIAGWRALDPALRDPLLDHWLHAQGLPAPTRAQRAQILRQCSARAGQSPCIRWPGAEVLVWKGRLWARRPQPDCDPDWQACWHGEPLQLPDGGELVLDPPLRLSVPLTVRLRRGGERLRPVGDRHTRELRDLFQAADVPPWQRRVCPLIYEETTLIGVADRWLTARGAAIFAGTRPRWRLARAPHEASAPGPATD
ncbi:tRNA lysidine(34) synthetase TilS [Aerosticca soli]|uniref:tRNA(Ile)-lysidine synthase n=1 Tax=Aerosticca soli TaxID=2010829 RepID=A0A2Z6E646_9GAMM|nr:tRNA lysidine(34) synthetase TilS [Aerosticca soli]BBD79949.1 tRNA(Ile)-lysidine synthetase [Aerosticca soli]